MEKLTNKELNQAQQLIYSKSNIRRAFNDFDDSDIAGLYMQDRKILIVRTDGSEQTYPIEPIQTAYRSYTLMSLVSTILLLNINSFYAKDFQTSKTFTRLFLFCKVNKQI
jgi:hypothetical protein